MQIFDIQFYLLYYKYLLFVVVTLLFYISIYREKIHFNDIMLGRWPVNLTAKVLIYTLFWISWAILQL